MIYQVGQLCTVGDGNHQVAPASRASSSRSRVVWAVVTCSVSPTPLDVHPALGEVVLLPNLAQVPAGLSQRGHDKAGADFLFAEILLVHFGLITHKDQ